MTGRPRVLLSSGSLYVMDLAAAFEVAAEVGFDGLEVLCDQRWSTRDPEYLSRLRERVGLPIIALHAPFESMASRLAGWPRRLDGRGRLERTVGLAETLGSELVVLHLPPKLGRFSIRVGKYGWTLPIPWQSDPEGMKAWMQEGLAAYQDTTQVKVAVENLPERRVLGRRVEPAWWSTLEEWPRTHRWLTLDSTHWGTRGVNPVDAYRAAGARVVHVHLSDFGPQEHQLPGTGRLPLAALLQAMAADGFAGTVSLELDPSNVVYTDGARLRKQLAEALAFCREHLGLPSG